MSKLSSRIESYIAISDYKLLDRLPIVIVLNGKNFSRITQLLDKPFDPIFSNCLVSATLQLCTQIEGVFFGYNYNDEIILISRNDQNLDTTPWLSNNLQKLCSTTAALATLYFNQDIHNTSLNISGEAIFTCQVFAVPTIVEAINTIIYKQSANNFSSIQMACLYSLLNKYDKNTIKDMLVGLSVDEKIDLLYQEGNIDFNEYPLAFRRGIAFYKVPKVIDQTIKNKWYINREVPIFTKEQNFLHNIFKNGADLFRAQT